VSGPRATLRRSAGWALALLALVNAGIVLALWWRAAGAGELDGTAAVLAEIARAAGLLGAYLVLSSCCCSRACPCSSAVPASAG
jgi:hypothetical protein